MSLATCITEHPLGLEHDQDTRGAVEQAAALVELGSKTNTLRSYRAAWEQWQSFCSSHGADALDPSNGPRLLLVWIGHLRREGLAATTIAARIAGVVHAFRSSGLPSPAEDERVRAARRGLVVDAATKGERPKQAIPMLTADLRRIVASLPDDARGRRDRFFLLLAFAAALRVEELARLSIRSIELQEKGLLVHLGVSKTDQHGAGASIPVRAGIGPLCPLAAARAWLETLGQAGITSGPLFRSIAPRTAKIGEGITPRRAADIVRTRGASVGILGLSGHSGRVGFVWTSSLAGASVQEIATVTRHSGPTVLRYVGRAHALHGADPLRGALGAS